MVNAYLPLMCAAAEHDETLAKSLMLVFGLKESPQGLLRPDRALRAQWSRLSPPTKP